MSLIGILITYMWIYKISYAERQLYPVDGKCMIVFRMGTSYFSVNHLVHLESAMWSTYELDRGYVESDQKRIHGKWSLPVTQLHHIRFKFFAMLRQQGNVLQPAELMLGYATLLQLCLLPSSRKLCSGFYRDLSWEPDD